MRLDHRIPTRFRVALLLVLMHFSTTVLGQESKAVEFDGTRYLPLDVVKDVLEAQSSFTKWASGIRIATGDKSWVLGSGGTTATGPDGSELALAHPMLVVNGQHLIAVKDCETVFGFRFDESADGLVTRLHNREASMRVTRLAVRNRRHSVSMLQPEHAVKRLIRPLPVLLRDKHAIPAGTKLLVRRSVVFDERPCLVVSATDESLESYLVDLAAFQMTTAVSDLKGTRWEQYMSRFAKDAAVSRGLRHGTRGQLQKSVALTVDLCWSLRPFEAEFFDSIQSLAETRHESCSLVLFASGRWIEQHPTEMDRLIDLSSLPSLNVIWGLHSWAHPKSGGFLNDFSEDDVRKDTLAVEQRLLEWGIVPTVWYRFPGLIHDQTRLSTILSLDLFPIDCDAWLAVQGSGHAYGNPVQDGSIILIHGNGNEPAGIRLWHQWLQKHRTWRLAPLKEFITNAESE